MLLGVVIALGVVSSVAALAASACRVFEGYWPRWWQLSYGWLIPGQATTAVRLLCRSIQDTPQLWQVSKLSNKIVKLNSLVLRTEIQFYNPSFEQAYWTIETAKSEGHGTDSIRITRIADQRRLWWSVLRARDNGKTNTHSILANNIARRIVETYGDSVKQLEKK